MEIDHAETIVALPCRATACKMSRIAMRGPVTILHVSQPTDAGVGKYIEDGARSGDRAALQATISEYDDYLSKVQIAYE